MKQFIFAVAFLVVFWGVMDLSQGTHVLVSVIHAVVHGAQLLAALLFA